MFLLLIGSSLGVIQITLSGGIAVDRYKNYSCRGGGGVFESYRPKLLGVPEFCIRQVTYS